MFNVIFRVKGDSVAGDLEIKRTLEDCETIEEMVGVTWKDYKEAIRYIYKRLESDIKCEPRPHNNFSVEVERDGFVINEDVILKAFFLRRVEEYHAIQPKWSDRGG